MKKTYLLKIFYLLNKNDLEYSTQEFLIVGTNKTIKNIAHEEVKKFNAMNKYKIEQISIYNHIFSESLKGCKNEL